MTKSITPREMESLQNKKQNQSIDGEIKTPPVKKSHWKRNVFLIMLLLLAVGIWFLYSYAQKPAEGKQIKSSSSEQDKAQALAESENVPELFQGKWFTFLYDKSYVLKSHDTSEKDGDVILEQAYLSQTSGMSKKIAVTVRSLPSQNLEDVPDFKMREMKTEKYKKENFQFGDLSGVSFVPADDSQFEKLFFILHKNFLVIVVMLAPRTEDAELDQEAATIVKSISWLK